MGELLKSLKELFLEIFAHKKAYASAVVVFLIVNLIADTEHAPPWPRWFQEGFMHVHRIYGILFGILVLISIWLSLREWGGIFLIIACLGLALFIVQAYESAEESSSAWLFHIWIVHRILLALLVGCVGYIADKISRAI